MDNQPRGIPPPADVRIAEKPMPMELKLPEAVRQEAVKGATRILKSLGTYDPESDTFKIHENRPDAVLVLLRSARLPLETVRAYLGSHRIEGELPPIIETGIGKAGVSVFFSDHHEGLGHDTEEDDSDIETLKDPTYQEWLDMEDNSVVKHIVHGLQSAVSPAPRRLLVVDDARGSGITFEKTLPPILKAAYGPGVSYETVLEFPEPLPRGKGWELSIIDENFPGVTKGQRHILHELIKGLLDRRILEREREFIHDPQARKEYDRELARLSKPDEDFIPITDEGAIKLLAYHSKLYTLDEQGVTATDLYRSLENTFGTGYLLQLPELAKNAFAQLSEGIAL